MAGRAQAAEREARARRPAAARRAVGGAAGGVQGRLERFAAGDRVRVDQARPPRRRAPRSRRRGRRAWTRRSCSRVGGRRLGPLEARPAGLLERRLDRPQPARVLGMRARCRGASEEGWRKIETHRLRVRYSPLADHAVSAERPDRRPRGRRRRGGGTARRARGRRGGRRGGVVVSRKPLPRARASGPRAGSRRRSRPTTRPPATPRTRSTPAAAFATRRRRGPDRRGPGRRRELLTQRAGSSSTSSRDGELALGLEGGHSARRIVHAGGSETGRAITSRLAELVAEHEPRSRCSRAPRRSPCGATASAAHGVAHRPRRDRAPAHGPGDRRRRGAVAAHHQPVGRDRRRRVLAHAAGAELADLELCQFHPTALALPGRRARRLADHRGGPRRGRDPPRRRRPPVHRRARPARPGDRGDPRPDGRRRDRPRRLDLRPIPPERFPTCSPTCRDAGFDPETRAGAGLPRRPLPDRRRPTDLDGRTTLPGLLAVGECCVHGAARRQPPRLQLAQRVLRVRQRAPPRAALAAPAGRHAADARDGRFPAPTPGRARRPSGSCAGPSRDAARLERLARRPLSAARTDRRLGPRPARIARRPPALRLPAAADPSLDLRHHVVSADGTLRLERWPPGSRGRRRPGHWRWILNPELNRGRTRFMCGPSHSPCAGGLPRTRKVQGNLCTNSVDRSTGSLPRGSWTTAIPDVRATARPQRMRGDDAPATQRPPLLRQADQGALLELRGHFPISEQLFVFQVVDRNVKLALRYLDHAPADELALIVERECKAHTRRGTPVSGSRCRDGTTARPTSTPRRTSWWSRTLERKEELQLVA